MQIKNIILGIIIAVVFVMFCAYGNDLVYKSPDYNDFCPAIYHDAQNQTTCEMQNGTWIAQNIECIKAPCPQGYCDYYSKCQPEFDKADKAYSKNMFLISIILGVIVISISAFFIDVESISSGVMFGSLMFIIYGTARYWRFMEGWGRFVILGIALAVLIYVGYRLKK